MMFAKRSPSRLTVFRVRVLRAATRRRAVGLLLAAFFICPQIARAAQPTAPIDREILAAVNTLGELEEERQELRAIYEELGGQPVWTTPARQSALLKMVDGLEADGIDRGRLETLPGSGRYSRTEDDVFATRAVLRAAHLMVAGATDAAAIPGWHLKTPRTNVAATVIAAAQKDSLAAALQELRPVHAAYGRLQSAYLHYRRLATAPWHEIETTGPRIVAPDDARMTEIAQRLTLLGDIGGADVLEPELTAGVKRFQHRHGLDVDGRIGPATLAQLNVSPTARAAQIAVNLEYWRLLPRTWPERYITVNAAAAHLDVVLDGKTIRETRVIVGDPDHPTPVIDAAIGAVTFNPPWTIPYSIATKEILPRLRRDSAYLERSNIEIIDRPVDQHGLQIDWRQYSRTNFPFQLRQVPGPGNALGLVKFEMPNRFDVYLHDTSDRSLFGRSSRALSHGCVRVQFAQELAQHLIDDPAVWLSPGVSLAIKEGRTVRIPLENTLPVYLLYFTAFVDRDGVVHFRPDIYGRDQAVLRALTTPYTTARAEARAAK